MNAHEYEEYMDILRHMEEIPVEPPEAFIDDYEEYYEPDFFPEPPDADYVNLHETPEEVTEAFNNARWVFANGVT